MNRRYLGSEGEERVMTSTKARRAWKKFQVDLAGANGMCVDSGFVEWKQTSADMEADWSMKRHLDVRRCCGWHRLTLSRGRVTARPVKQNTILEVKRNIWRRPGRMAHFGTAERQGLSNLGYPPIALSCYSCDFNPKDLDRHARPLALHALQLQDIWVGERNPAAIDGFWQDEMKRRCGRSLCVRLPYQGKWIISDICDPKLVFQCIDVSRYSNLWSVYSAIHELNWFMMSLLRKTVLVMLSLINTDRTMQQQWLQSKMEKNWDKMVLSCWGSCCVAPLSEWIPSALTTEQIACINMHKAKEWWC